MHYILNVMHKKTNSFNYYLSIHNVIINIKTKGKKYHNTKNKIKIERRMSRKVKAGNEKDVLMTEHRIKMELQKVSQHSPTALLLLIQQQTLSPFTCIFILIITDLYCVCAVYVFGLCPSAAFAFAAAGVCVLISRSSSSQKINK